MGTDSLNRAQLHVITAELEEVTEHVIADVSHNNQPEEDATVERVLPLHHLTGHDPGGIGSHAESEVAG
jgi:hypothetical protein